ncbi:MAG: nucleoside triphosphate pyrophosphohydrolase [Treponema sp.]|jgi:tetrapyrrole methylase family protein/MazG family protein|nr:nucleoside triphosphate pyrophosphohydrolase [Treponema sp.]
MNTGEAFRGLYDIVVRLRALDGCPWDREQTPLTLRGNLVEETYECIEAIGEKDSSHTREELGDIYLLATMISYMYEQEGLFSVQDVLQEVSEKYIRRHPHVFGGVKVRDSAEVLENWQQIKVEQEGRKPKDSILDEVSRGLPPLEKAQKLQKKAAKLGFDWLEVQDVIAKLEEELQEVQDAIAALDISAKTEELEPAAVSGDNIEALQSNLEDELGDVLFSIVNLCRFLNVDSSIALERANSKFTKRFKHVEKRMRESNTEMKQENLKLMDSFWEDAKAAQL